MKFSKKIILFDTDTGYLFRYEQVNSAISCFNLAVHRRTAFDQCNLLKAYRLLQSIMIILWSSR